MRLRQLTFFVTLVAVVLSTGCCCHRRCMRRGCCAPAACCAPVSCCHPGDDGLPSGVAGAHPGVPFAPPLAPPLAPVGPLSGVK